MARWLIGLAISTVMAFGCDCRRPDAHQSIERRPAIFIGEVIDGGVTSIREDPWHSTATHVRFRVIESFRGLPAEAKTVDLKLRPPDGMCSANPYFPGRRYLVAPFYVGADLTDGPCFSGRDITESREVVDQVRGYFRGWTPIIRGRVTIGAKAVAGATVSASRGDKTYTATADNEGRYQLRVAAGGWYRVWATFPPYTSPDDVAVRVLDGAGALQDLGMKVDNTISGRVTDQKGRPVRARVALIDLNRKDPGNPRWLCSRQTGKDGSFVLANVPIGRYLLVFNPDGPGLGSFDSPLETAYYPGASSRANARVIEVRSAGVHLKGKDLIAGKRAAFRKVTVRVRFPDGTPMKHAEVVCSGSPAREGDFEWSYSMHAWQGGSVEFSAPANRKLRIDVRDWLGRDLKTDYSSFHEPGRTPIEKEFVVVP